MTGLLEAAAVEMDELTLIDWRRHTSAIYREVREASSPEAAHAIWRARRDELFRDHPSSPLAEDDPLRESGLPYWPYDPLWRYELEVIPTISATRLSVNTGPEETTHLRRLRRRLRRRWTSGGSASTAEDCFCHCVTGRPAGEATGAVATSRTR
jgi:hypothetical protein